MNMNGSQKSPGSSPDPESSTDSSTALVVYESMFGNTEQIAQAVAAGLARVMPVEPLEVQHAPSEGVERATLVVAGGPTHAFSMTRESTRTDAFRQGATQGSESTGLREWLDSLPRGHHAPKVATFDTRVAKVRHLPGSAAKSAAKAAHRHGFEQAAKPESFYVDDVAGPLLDGELERAEAWGAELGELAHSVTPADTTS